MSKSIVIFYSWAGHTRRMAEAIAAETGADLLEIQPREAYPASYRETLRRSKAELDTGRLPDIRPAGQDLKGYDTVYIGYPIWWDAAPRVVNTFIESVSLEGKTVIPFATSGGSSINGSVSALRRSYPNIRWQDGRLLNGMSEKAIRAWVEKSADGK